jgi:hypothetical protein
MIWTSSCCDLRRHRHVSHPPRGRFRNICRAGKGSVGLALFTTRPPYMNEKIGSSCHSLTVCIFCAMIFLLSKRSVSHMQPSQWRVYIPNKDHWVVKHRRSVLRNTSEVDKFSAGCAKSRSGMTSICGITLTGVESPAMPVSCSCDANAGQTPLWAILSR